MSKSILIADDDASIVAVLKEGVRRRGYTPLCTSDGRELMEWIHAGKGDALITDVLMPFAGRDASSFEWLPEITHLRPELPIILISAQNTLATAVKATQAGVFEYLPKPFDMEALFACVEKSLAAPPNARIQKPSLRDSLGSPLVGTSPAMQAVYRTLARVVDVDLTIMITGESGTGKELVARALHDLGPRKRAPFVAVNMAAIPRELAESELFGHEKGAFTGALSRKSGKFEQAEGGTLFLDEIGDMPLDAQTKLLRVLQEGEFTTVGGTKPEKTNVRIICATHRDLHERVKEGHFREDLYYRLKVVPIALPPLRERKEDIPQLAEYFLKKAASKGLPAKMLDDSALQALTQHNWPGNIRELENFVYRVCTLEAERHLNAQALASYLPVAVEARTPGTVHSLEQYIAEQLRIYFAAHEGSLPPSGLYDRLLPVLERPLIMQALTATGGNQLRAAELLGINRNTLRKRILELGIDKLTRE